MSLTVEEIRELSVDERLNLMEVIWDTLDEERNHLELTDEQREELDRRLDEYDRNPEPGTPWREALKRIEDSL